MSSRYQMWLTYDAEKNKIKFPVLPESITIKNGSNNTNVSIVGLGEITIKQDRKAFVYSFSSFLPADDFPGIHASKIVTKKNKSKKKNVVEDPSPTQIIEKINKWKENKKPVHFMITGCLVDCYCTIENFNYEEDGGDVGSYQYSLELKEYREVEVRKINKKKKSKKAKKKATSKRVNSKAVPSTYTVKKGDSLWNIAKKYYGDGSKYKKIYNANKKVIGSNPNKIKAGQVLKLPN